MAFNVLFLAHAPDVNSAKHRCLVESPKYKLFLRVVKDQDEALETCKNLVRDKGIHSILLCPGFKHKDVAEIKEAAGENVGVFVARGDGPSQGVTMEVMKREGWFPGERKDLE